MPVCSPLQGRGVFTGARPRVFVSDHAELEEARPEDGALQAVTQVPVGIHGRITSRNQEDRYLLTRSELRERLTVLLAGRCAEELIFQEVSTGAQDDLLKATDMARRMVAAYGMSERLGPVSFEQKRRPLFLPESLPGARDYAEETARAIDEEVKVLVQEACERARTILGKKQEMLHRLAKLLLDREVIEGEELREILGL